MLTGWGTRVSTLLNPGGEFSVVLTVSGHSHSTRLFLARRNNGAHRIGALCSRNYLLVDYQAEIVVLLITVEQSDQCYAITIVISNYAAMALGHGL